MNKITVRSNPKINLTLDVLGRRSDGYHEVKMLMQSLDIFDVISLEKRDKDISISTNLHYLPCDRRNIAYKAAELFFNEFGILDEGIHIDIKKYIPVAAGLAGGSSNAAAVLKGMCKLYNIKCDEKKLMKIGERLGADVPYCIKGGTALAEGLGEIITPVCAFKDVCICLVKPNFSVSTADIFKALECDKIKIHPNTDHMIELIQKLDIKGVAFGLCNVLENVTVNQHPQIRILKDEMKRNGALGSVMSGSGPTVFGVFEDFFSAVKAQNYFRDKGLFSVATKTI